MKALQAQVMAVYRGNGFGSTRPMFHAELFGAESEALAYSSAGAFVAEEDVEGNVINAASASQTDVAAAIAAASPGDTVQVPAGSGTWNSLSIAKAIHLVGAGVGSTNITLGTSNSITKQSSGATYIRGFSFSRSGGGNANHAWTISGSWPAGVVVIEECAHTQSDSGLYQISTPGGVIIAKCSFSAQVDDSIIRPKHISMASWQADDTIGSRDATGRANIYVEDCYFLGGGNQGMDVDDGGRMVFRYNRCDIFCLNSHGMDTSEVGCRHVEAYNNDWRYARSGQTLTSSFANQNRVIWVRGGVWVIHNNVIDDIAGTTWGPDKPELAVDIRSQQDGSGSSYGSQSPPVAFLSSGQGNYPRQHAASVNWSSAVETNGGYFVDPLYWWDNTGSGISSGGPKNFQNGGNWGSHAGHFNSGRDYFFGTERPDYSTYTYPHPLRMTSGQAY